MLIYGDEKVDPVLVESIRTKGLLEPLVIKDDDTIISGHRRWLATKELGINVQCRLMSFVDELDEKEALIEFNKQRKKTYSQVYSEDRTLREIYTERAKRRQVEAGIEHAANLNNQVSRVPLNFRLDLNWQLFPCFVKMKKVTLNSSFCKNKAVYSLQY